RYLTYDDVNAYLPDQDVTPEKLDNLLVALEDIGIELLDKAPVKPGQPQLKIFPPVDDQPSLIKPEEEKKLNSDPIRLYLAQMSQITAESDRSEEHTSELQSLAYLVCRLLLEKKKNKN